MHVRERPLPQLKGQMFVTDGGIETHLIFNEGEDLPDMSAYLLNMSERGRDKMREYYRAYIPIAQKVGTGLPVRYQYLARQSRLGCAARL